jgi:hypothetical protein
MFNKFSPDESFALIVSALVGFISWARWYYVLGVTGRRVRVRGKRWPLALAPLVCMLVAWVVLSRWSAEDVRTDAAYIWFYMVIGLAWLGIFRLHLPLFGLNARDDVLERDNNVTGWVVVAALLAGACCFAGGNVGNGPGWWVVLFAGLLSTGSLLVLWVAVHLGSGLVEKVSVERDPAAGLRASGLLIGAGLILGRAVAGNWVSAYDTLIDFGRMGWPVLVLAAAAIAVERSIVPSRNPGPAARGSLGWLPALIYVAAGVVVLVVT